LADIGGTVDRLAGFIEVPAVARTIPSREELAAIDGKWVRSASAPNRTRLSAEQVELFWQVNAATMREYGYCR